MKFSYGALLAFLILLTCVLTYDLDHILNKDYISDVEYIFEPNSINEDSVMTSFLNYEIG